MRARKNRKKFPKLQRVKLSRPISCHWSLLYPLTTSENQRFSDVFKGYRKRPVA